MAKGGARKGAGRKPRPPGETRVTRAFRLLPEHSTELGQAAALAGMTTSAWIDQAIQRALGTFRQTPMLSLETLHTRDPYLGTGGQYRWDCTFCNGVGEAAQLVPGVWRCERCGSSGRVEAGVIHVKVKEPAPESPQAKVIERSRPRRTMNLSPEERARRAERMRQVVEDRRQKKSPEPRQ